MGKKETEISLKKVPIREDLEDFLKSMYGQPSHFGGRVLFDQQKGVFERKPKSRPDKSKKI